MIGRFMPLVIVIVLVFNPSSPSGEYFQIPEVFCPSVFRYVSEGSRYFGLITVEGISYGETTVQIDMRHPPALLSALETKLTPEARQQRIATVRASITSWTRRQTIELMPENGPNSILYDTACKEFVKRQNNKDCHRKLCVQIGKNETSDDEIKVAIRTIKQECNLKTAIIENRKKYDNSKNSKLWCLNKLRFFESFGDAVTTSIANLPLVHEFTTVHEVCNKYHREMTDLVNEYSGKLAPNVNQTEIFDSIRSGRPVTYRVDFPIQNIIPRVVGITVNNVKICHDPTDRQPRTFLNLEHILRATLTQSTIFPTISPTNTIDPRLSPPDSIDLDCGKENVNGIGLAVNGEVIAKSRFPWIVAIYTRNSGSLSFQCGGSLISSRTVLSAAHCLTFSSETIRPKDLLLSIGRHNLSDIENTLNIGVEKFFIHPDFKAGPTVSDSYDGDVAILLLKRDVNFSQEIRPICLWQGSSDVRDIEGILGVMVGWGEDESHTGISSVPKLVNATVVSDSTCLRSNEKLLHITSNRTLCAGNRDGSGPCLGDSGSGLMIRNGYKWMLRGIVSAALVNSARQCDLNEYVVFADIAQFLDWIKSNML